MIARVPDVPRPSQFFLERLDQGDEVYVELTWDLRIKKAPHCGWLRVAVLRVETTPPGATIYINRKDLGSRGNAPLPLALAEGKYTVIAELPGYEPATSAAVDVKLGAEAVVPLTLRRIVGKVKIGIEGADTAAVHVDDEHAPPA